MALAATDQEARLNRFLTLLSFLFAAGFLLADDDPHPTLPIGSPAPDFSLPGIDGQIHKLSEYAAAKVLAIVFTCNHCPTAQLYESRIKKLGGRLSRPRRHAGRHPTERPGSDLA